MAGRSLSGKQAEPVGRIPFLVLTGFLGSGKTTVLNRLLREGGRWLVLMNEFGQEPLDQQLLERQDLPLALLSGGCVCCTVRGALAPMLKNLYMGRSTGATRFDRVVMETSGVADPGPVLDTLLKDRWLASRYRLVAIAATVDAQRGLMPVERYPEAAQQVALADRLLITQADLATPESVDLLRRGLTRMNPAAEIVITAQADWEAQSLLLPAVSIRRFPTRATVPSAEATDFMSASVVFNKPLRKDASAILKRLFEGVGCSIPRLKGVLDIEEESCPVVVHGVEGRIYPISRLARWPDGERRSRLVAIGAEADQGAVMRFLHEFEQAMSDYTLSATI